MNILAFDTTGDYCVIAVNYNDKLFYKSTDLTQGHATFLLPLIIEVMDKIKFTELDLIGVVNGPGSFTGIRIGLATAHGLSMAANLPLIPISAFELYARPGATVLIDSRRGDLFVKKDGQAAHILKPEDINANWDITGNGVKLIDPTRIITPDPQTLIDLTREKWQSGKFSGLRQDCQPLYLREPDAVIKNKSL